MSRVLGGVGGWWKEEKGDRRPAPPATHPLSLAPLSRPDAISEVLHDSLRQSRRTVVELEAVAQVVAALLAREKRQFERLQFALKKAGNDAAFAKSVARVRAAEKEELRRYKEKYGELAE